MKKTFTILFALILGISLYAQQVDRDMVIVEIGTGFWCGYCPGAAMGADDLVENGHNVAIFENHNGDSLANVYSNARNSYYGITGYPTAFFDGTLSVVGGSATQSMYSSYLPKVNARNNVQSDFTMDLSFESTGEGSYTATVEIENVGGNTSSTLVLQLGVTESNLPITWGGMNHVNFVTRKLFPNQNGTALDFSGGNTQTITLDFETSYWDTDYCELIAYIQDNSDKEIQQGTKVFLAEALYTLDAQIKAINYPEGAFCGSSVEPVVLIKNMGSDNLISLDIEYSINGGTTQTYAWTGDLGFNLGEEVTLPEISFASQNPNSITVTGLNPNGDDDLNPENNTLTKEFDPAPQAPTSTVLFELKTDQYPEETTWVVKNSSGQTLYSGGPYNGQANTVFNETWDLPELDCYEFIIYDAYGDGICCSYGNGYYELMDENNIVLIEGGEFGSEETKSFERFDASVVTANFMADVTAILEGESVQFTDLSSGDITTWEWTFEGGDPATSNDQNPMVTYNIPGIYDVSLTVSNATSSNTFVQEDYITVDALSGLQEITVEGFVVYPNPFDNFTNISLNIIEANNVSILVYNLMGKVVYESNEGFFNAGTHKLTLNAENLENGIYFIKVSVGNEIFSHKVSIIK